MHDTQHGATSFASAERATASRIRGASPTDEVLSRAGDAINEAMAANTKAPVPQLHLVSYDGDVVHGGLIGGYKLRLHLDGDHGVLELPFPSADRAGEHAEEIREAVVILNRAIARATRAFAEPLPEPVDCRHTVRIEPGEEGEQIAVCRSCTTIVVHDVRAWAIDHQEQIASRGLQTITSAIDYFARGR